MPRLRRRLPILEEWREQIRGGLWYKPGWWDAVRQVPPLPDPANIKKKDIPVIQFVEERLIKEFAEKNPAIAKYDAPAMLEDGHSQRLRSVAAEFAHKQVSEMQAGKPKEEAYDTAKEWLLENGRQFYDRLQPPTEVEQDLTFLKRTSGQDAASIVSNILSEQRKAVRTSLNQSVQTYIDTGGASTAAKQGQRGVKLLKHKNLMLSADEIRTIQSRGGESGLCTGAPADAAANSRS